MPESQQGSSQSVETTAQFGKGEIGEAKRWLAEIRMYESEVRDWTKRADKITKKYRNEKFSDYAATNSDSARTFAMFWANIQTLQPTILANPPSANVTRRFKDDDPVGRVAAEIGERDLDYVIDQEGYYDALKSGRDDYLLYGIGQQRWRYVPSFAEMRVPLQISDDQSCYTSGSGEKYEKDDEAVETDDDGAYIMDRELENEKVVCEYVNWKDWGRTPGARRWGEVTMVYFTSYLDRDELIARFGEKKGKEVTLDHEPPKGSWGDKEEKSFFKKGTVYEIWDKSKREVIWLAKNSSDPGLLDKRDDPLKIKGFFPCPRPLLGTTTNDKFQPVPDFLMYQDQAQELDRLTQRIYALIEAIKVKGLYAGNLPEISDLLNDAQELDMTPVAESIVALINGDLSKSVWMWPIEVMVSALNELIAARNVVKQDAYEITGLSDIIRGASDPKETLGAQQLKVQSGSIRVRDRQQEMARWIRDGLRIAFDIIFNQFQPKTIAMMCDLPGIKEASQPYMPKQPGAPGMGHNGGPAGPLPGAPNAPMMPSGTSPVPASDGMGAPPTATPGGPPSLPPGALPGVPQGIPMQPPAMPAPQLPPPPTIGEMAIKLLQDPQKRQFRIDIETDSTIEIDQNAEKAARTEFVTAVGTFIEGAAPVLAQAPEFIPMFGEMLLFAVRGFKAGDQLESVIEKSMEALHKRAEQAASQPPPPDPEMVKAQAEAKAREQEAQIDAAKAARETQTEQQSAAIEAQARQQEVAADGQRMQMDAAAEASRARTEQMLGAMELQLKQIQLLIESKKLEQADAGITAAQAQAKSAEKKANAPVNGGAA